MSLLATRLTCLRSSDTSAASGAARACETLIHAPVPPHVVDKGIPAAGLLAQVLIAKYDGHLPSYRQQRTSGARGWQSLTRRLTPGSAYVVCGCSRWSMRSTMTAAAGRAACG